MQGNGVRVTWVDLLINDELDIDCHCGIPAFKQGSRVCHECFEAGCGMMNDTRVYCLVKQPQKRETRIKGAGRGPRARVNRGSNCKPG